MIIYFFFVLFRVEKLEPLFTNRQINVTFSKLFVWHFDFHVGNLYLGQFINIIFIIFPQKANCHTKSDFIFLVLSYDVQINYFNIFFVCYVCVSYVSCYLAFVICVCMFCWFVMTSWLLT